jgi:hypothetical protein
MKLFSKKQLYWWSWTVPNSAMHTFCRSLSIDGDRSTIRARRCLSCAWLRSMPGPAGRPAVEMRTVKTTRAKYCELPRPHPLQAIVRRSDPTTTSCSSSRHTQQAPYSSLAPRAPLPAGPAGRAKSFCWWRLARRPYRPAGTEHVSRGSPVAATTTHTTTTHGVHSAAGRSQPRASLRAGAHVRRPRACARACDGLMSRHTVPVPAPIPERSWLVAPCLRGTGMPVAWMRLALSGGRSSTTDRIVRPVSYHWSMVIRAVLKHHGGLLWLAIAACLWEDTRAGKLTTTTPIYRKI